MTDRIDCSWRTCDRTAVQVVLCAGPTYERPTCKRCCGVVIGKAGDRAYVVSLAVWREARAKVDARTNGKAAA